MAKKRVGILGGTFDPIHLGHLHMGLSVLDAGYVDRVLVMPSGSPPHKAAPADAEDRWKMVVAACARDKRLVPSRQELDRRGSVYTVDTLRALRESDPDASFFFVIGSDALMSLRSWKHAEKLLSLCTFLVCPRSSVPSGECADELARLTAMGGTFIQVPMESFDVSSEEIRRSLANGEEPSALDVSTLEFCCCKGLYGYPGRLDRIDSWIGKLFDSLKPKRFAHTLSVAHTARLLARIHGINPLQAEQAGILHDCAKCLPLPEMQRIAVKHGLTDDESILRSEALLHSVVGAWVAQSRYGMTDPEVLEAVAYHNTGRAGMSRLAMCVCLSDSIEPLRQSYPLLEEIRALADRSLERALLLSLESTADYVVSRGYYLHPRTRETIAWLKTLPAVTGR